MEGQSNMKQRINIFWFRRDLRLDDNHGLFKALTSSNKVLPIFIFDTEILKQFPDTEDKRVSFIFQTLEEINFKLKKEYKSNIQYFHGKPIEVFKSLEENYTIDSLYFNEDYEPYANKRDKEIKDYFESKNIKVLSFKDTLIFHKDDILKTDNKPYTVYTPYSKVWLEKFAKTTLEYYPSEEYLNNLIRIENNNFDLEHIGYKPCGDVFPKYIIDEDIIINYENTRDKPYLEKGVSRVGVELRFGRISIRKLADTANRLSLTYLKEIIWREFFMQILYNFPYVENSSFKLKYNRIKWENDEILFDKWCKGETGYPIVDAGMRELNSTGFMHNRVRMITASFLTKHLLIDWRWGELYFANKLMDYELSSNNGNWQWVAGSGCDASPYFRIFNPITQQKKFDPKFQYIKKWVEEFGTKEYPNPIIDHSFARNRTLSRFKKDLEDE